MRRLLLVALLVPVLALGDIVVNQGQGNPRQAPWSVSSPPYQRGAFGPLAVESETVELHLQFPYAINTRIVSTATANGGTVTQGNNLATLATSAAANGAAQVESLSSIKYTPGQGVIVRFTAIFTACTANSQQEIGIGTQADGFFFGCQGATFGVFRRQNSVDNFTAQSSWNGAMQPSFVPTNGNVFQIEYQWLGFGAIRFFMENAATGEPILVHTIPYANSNTIPSIFNPSLPLHARVFNTTNATNVAMSIGSMGAATQGPRNDFGVNNAYVSNKACAASGNPANVFTLQNRSTFNLISNRTRLKLTAITATCTGAAGIVRLLHAGTEAGVPSFTNVDTTRSIAAVDTAGTTVSNGDFIFPLAVGTNATAQADLENKNYRLDPGDTFNFVCEPATATCTIGVSWREEF